MRIIIVALRMMIVIDHFDFDDGEIVLKIKLGLGKTVSPTARRGTRITTGAGPDGI